jgi:hypothetical protein
VGHAAERQTGFFDPVSLELGPGRNRDERERAGKTISDFRNPATAISSPALRGNQVMSMDPVGRSTSSSMRAIRSVPPVMNLAVGRRPSFAPHRRRRRLWRTKN